MKNKFMLGMLCVALLICTLPVSAATSDACDHIYTSFNTYQKIEYKNNDYHAYTYQQGEICTKCGELGNVKKVTELEIHLPSGTYTDLGHDGTSIHRFNVKCSKCNHYYMLAIACNGDATGRHVYPY